MLSVNTTGGIRLSARSSCISSITASHDCDIVFYNLIVHFLILYYKPLLTANDPGCYLRWIFLWCVGRAELANLSAC